MPRLTNWDNSQVQTLKKVSHWPSTRLHFSSRQTLWELKSPLESATDKTGRFENSVNSSRYQVSPPPTPHDKGANNVLCERREQCLHARRQPLSAGCRMCSTYIPARFDLLQYWYFGHLKRFKCDVKIVFGALQWLSSDAIRIMCVCSCKQQGFLCSNSLSTLQTNSKEEQCELTSEALAF